MKRFAFLAGVAILISACGRSDTPPEPTSSVQTPEKEKPAVVQPAQGEGVIIGEILFKGVPPVSKRIAVNKDQEACGEFSDSETLVVGPNKGVRWAVVLLKSPPLEMRWEGTKLDQRGCRFSPHVLLVPTGSKVSVLNPDGVLHNFHTYSTENPAINKAQPKFRKEMAVEFQKPERFRIGCDAHSWMSGWIVAVDHPYYAVTDEEGRFKFENVPVGTRVLRVWHEALGELVAEVEVKADQISKVSFNWELKEAK